MGKEEGKQATRTRRSNFLSRQKKKSSEKTRTQPGVGKKDKLKTRNTSSLHLLPIEPLNNLVWKKGGNILGGGNQRLGRRKGRRGKNSWELEGGRQKGVGERKVMGKRDAPNHNSNVSEQKDPRKRKGMSHTSTLEKDQIQKNS